MSAATRIRTWLDRKLNGHIYRDSAKSLEAYEQLNRAKALNTESEFLTTLTDENLKQFWIAQAEESKNNLIRLDLIAKEMKKRGFE